MSTGPVTREVTIVNQRGLHARAAAKFVRAAGEFDAAVEVTRDDTTVAGTSILGLMLLGAGIGSTLTLKAEGTDAEAAIAAIADLVERGFDEG
ncbi:MAG TPA: HPr family phosphocarrier protein [Geminicoccaceae bacterium]